MNKFETLTAIAAPFPKKNVDTDLIIRIERCTGMPKEDLGKYAFEMARTLPNGDEDPAFVFNQPRYRSPKIIVCGEFFGTGSSREVAVWALESMGVRCVIAPSFGDIFFNNCFQNGVLPVLLPEPRVNELLRFLLELPGAEITVDLADQTVSGPDGKVDKFEIDSFRKDCLLEGIDEISMTLSYEADIKAFEARHSA